jgi:hypothetical protein
MLKSKTLAPVFIFALLFFAAAGAAFAQEARPTRRADTDYPARQENPGELRGQVLLYSEGRRAPLAGALVEIYCVVPLRSYFKSVYGIGVPVSFSQRRRAPCNFTARTDGGGRFAVNVPPDYPTYIIAVSADGARPQLLTHARVGGRGHVITLRPGDGSRIPEEEARAGTGRDEESRKKALDALEGGSDSGKEVGSAGGGSAAKDTSPPQINITSPQQNRGMKLSTQSSKVTVAGQVTDTSGVNDVLVQDAPARLDEQGNFSADVLLKVGENKITVTAIDISGNRNTTDFTLYREAQPASSGAPSAEDAPAAEGAASSLTSGRYYALVIGINEYKQLPQLKTAESDAKAIAAILRDRLGFEVNLLLNATRGQIVGALNKYRQELDASANLVIYYAGHGYFDKQVDKAYWLPVDAALSDNSNWISADDVTVNVKGIPAKHVLIVSDSCYSGTIVRGINPELSKPAARDRYIQRMLEGRSRTLIASGGNEPVADGGEGGHSVFASALLRGLNQTSADAFTAEELFYSHIREAVSGRSEQTPEYNPLRNSGHESGDFVFVRKKQ